MSKASVSLVKVSEVYESLGQALDLCDGLAGLQVDDKILLKPNIVSWDFDYPFPPRIIDLVPAPRVPKTNGTWGI